MNKTAIKDTQKNYPIVEPKRIGIDLLLNKAKSGNLLNSEELEIVKKCVNNSLVGTSKLLHFINPSIYAIWDSKIFRNITEKKIFLRY